MTGMEAIGLMLIDKKIIAARNENLGCLLRFDLIAANGISLTAEQLTSEIWEIGRECETCNGDGLVTVPCPLCSGASLHRLLENPCCGGFDDAACQECEEEGIIWSQEY